MKKIIILIILLAISFLSNIILLLINHNIRYDLSYQKSIPDVQLNNSLVLENGLVSGGVVGFVKFNKKEDQPRSLKQYVSIAPLEELDRNGNQFFSVQDILVIDSLPINYVDPVVLSINHEMIKYLINVLN